MVPETLIARFDQEVTNFKRWAAEIPLASRSGEWECDYPNWDQLYVAWRELHRGTRLGDWSLSLKETFLYALARDNENRLIVSDICEHGDQDILLISEWALELGESEAQYQCAQALARCPLQTAEPLLLRFSDSADEYVRRLALGSLAALHSSRTEQVALELWEKAPPDCPWSKMMVLSALVSVGSHEADRLIAEARNESDAELVQYAANLDRARAPE